MARTAPLASVEVGHEAAEHNPAKVRNEAKDVVLQRKSPQGCPFVRL